MNAMIAPPRDPWAERLALLVRHPDLIRPRPACVLSLVRLQLKQRESQLSGDDKDLICEAVDEVQHALSVGSRA